MQRFKEIFVPAAIISSLIMGAGVFSLPYLFSQAGIFIGFFYLAFFALIMSSIHLMYGEIVEHTPGEHRFVGFAKKYLGKFGLKISYFTTILGILISLLIYITLSTKFINSIYKFENSFLPTLIFWAFASFPVILKIRKVAELGVTLIAGVLITIFAVFLWGAQYFSFMNFTPANWTLVFLPISGVLFSLAGRSSISTAWAYLKKNKFEGNKFGISILIGSIIPAFMYALFVIGILGISGASVTADAISGLSSVPVLLILAGCLGILGITNAYIFLSIELRENLIDDLGVKRRTAEALVIFSPLVLFLLGFNNLLNLIGLAGGVLLALDSILVILMWNRKKKRKPILIVGSIAISLVFFITIIQEIYRHFG